MWSQRQRSELRCQNQGTPRITRGPRSLQKDKKQTLPQIPPEATSPDDTLTSDFWSSGSEGIHFCHIKSPHLWYFVTAAQEIHMAPMILTISADPNIKPAKDKRKNKSADHLHPLKLQKDKINLKKNSSHPGESRDIGRKNTPPSSIKAGSRMAEASQC